MQIEKAFNLFTIVITVIYVVVMFNFLMKLEKQESTKHLNLQLNSKDLNEQNKVIQKNSRVECNAY